MTDEYTATIDGKQVRAEVRLEHGVLTNRWYGHVHLCIPLDAQTEDGSWSDGRRRAEEELRGIMRANNWFRAKSLFRRFVWPR